VHQNYCLQSGWWGFESVQWAGYFSLPLCSAMIEANSVNITKLTQQTVRNIDHKLLYTPVGLDILRVCTHWCTLDRRDRNMAWRGHSSRYYMVLHTDLDWMQHYPLRISMWCHEISNFKKKLSCHASICSVWCALVCICSKFPPEKNNVFMINGTALHYW